MPLNPEKMLQRCQEGQWSVDDFDWTETPRVTLSRRDEIRVCQLYKDMSYIERLAGALFLALSKRLEDPTLKAIYESFYVDEVRHSLAAEKLMDYFDVHHYKVYTPNFAMTRFIPYFISAVENLHPAVANSFILNGELILDIALLRGLNDYVDDPMSRAVVDKINQDESRHLGMDFFMSEYCIDHKLSPVSGKQGRPDFSNPDMRGLLFWAPHFFNGVFYKPMRFLDPSQTQLKKVMKRMRRFNMRPEVQRNPAVANFNDMADFFESRLGSKVGWGLERFFDNAFDIDFSFVRAGASDKVAPPIDWEQQEGAEALARAKVA